MSWPIVLADRRLYRTLLDRLETKYATTHRSDLLEDGLPTRHLLFEKDALAGHLRREIVDETYRAKPGTVRQVRLEKMRSLFRCDLTDFLVHGAVAEVLAEASAPHLSPHLYSYKRGASRQHALLAFAQYVRLHRRHVTSARERGLYVLRRDIRAYTDSIPVDRASPLWSDLRDLAVLSRAQVTPFVWTLIEGVIRPVVRTDAGEHCATIGIPTGSPVSPVIANLYLSPLDAALEAIDGSFYARYGDDVLFAHPSAEVARRASDTIDGVLRARRLELNRDKARDIFFNGAGRPSPAWPSARPLTGIDFLGATVSFHGTVGLSPQKLRQLTTDLADRAQRCVRALGDAEADRKGRVVCAALNHALDVRGPLAAHATAVLITTMTDRSQLRDLDHRIARIVAAAVTGNRGVRAFRQVPYKTIRDEWNLVSLERSRNARR